MPFSYIYRSLLAWPIYSLVKYLGGGECSTVVFLAYFEYFLSWNFGDGILRTRSGLKWKESVLEKSNLSGTRAAQESMRLPCLHFMFHLQGQNLCSSQPSPAAGTYTLSRKTNRPSHSSNAAQRIRVRWEKAGTKIWSFSIFLLLTGHPAAYRPPVDPYSPTDGPLSMANKGSSVISPLLNFTYGPDSLFLLSMAIFNYWQISDYYVYNSLFWSRLPSSLPG